MRCNCKGRPEHDYDCNTCEFDFEKHAEDYINYLEVLIAPDGTVSYAHPSHAMFLERVLQNKQGQEWFKRFVAENTDNDWITELCIASGHISVWNNFYYGTPNEAQLAALKRLASTKYKRCEGNLYQGEINK